MKIAQALPIEEVLRLEDDVHVRHIPEYKKVKAENGRFPQGWMVKVCERRTSKSTDAEEIIDILPPWHPDLIEDDPFDPLLAVASAMDLDDETVARSLKS